MKIERTKNATRNITFGVLLRIYQIAVPFLMRTALIYMLGVEYLGLHSLFASILHVLNLAELGVGNAMVYSMYKPIAEDDTASICALMRLYRLYYRIIGLVIAVAGLMLTPFIPKLIKGSVPADINVYILYLLNLGATCLSYWLFAYKNSLFMAHQRTDISSKVALAVNTMQYALQIVLLWIFHNYYFYIIIALATQAVTNVVTAVIATKMYPQYIPAGDLPKQQKKVISGRIRDLFTSKIGGVILSSSDTIVISSFLGLTMLAVYQNYYFILSSIISIVATVFQASMAGIGNSLLTESSEKNYRDLIKFTFLISWLSGVCACCFLNMFQPFIELWVGEQFMLSFGVVICLVVYYYFYELNQMMNTFKEAAGIWHHDRFRPLITAMVNLGLNLLTVKVLGVYGVVLSTVVSWLVVGMPWLLHNLFTYMFEKKYLWKYLRTVVGYGIVSFLACVITYGLCRFVAGNLVFRVFMCAVISAVVPNVFFYFVYSKRSEFAECVELVDRMTKGKLHLKKLARNH